MGKVVVAEYLTLDGVMEDPGPSGDFEYRGWTVPYWSDELGEYQTELLFASDALLLGRVTYEEFVAAWPWRSGDPFTDRINSMPKLVASRTLEEPLDWNARLLNGDVVEEVRKLRDRPGHDLLVYGSSELVRTLRQHDLIDVYRLMLYPVDLGCGRRLFRESGVKTALRLTDALTTDRGVLVLTYEPARRRANGIGRTQASVASTMTGAAANRLRAAS